MLLATWFIVMGAATILFSPPIVWGDELVDNEEFVVDDDEEFVLDVEFVDVEDKVKVDKDSGRKK